MRSEPVVVEERVAPPEAALLLSIPPDLEYLAGHFPASPIVAGVVQLKWAIDAARRVLAVTGDVTRMEALKFQRVLTPGATATLTLEWSSDDCKLYFAYESQGVRFSSGRLLFGPVA